ncbi:YeiH family protein [Actinosynnema sp. ALI-1.44]|uniref:YeiH family protein n=1 Tax=Actinosynnema sp. ALI-1.44 TaxID=1933779 RepID=UPI001177FBBA|nr:putative sulfate exporter family transporter [Actinosynnema sp. ALI-1.44]
MWVVLTGAAVALAINYFVPVLSALTVAVLLGVAVPVHADLKQVTRRFLRAGVVLLGLQLSLSEVTSLGFGTVIAVVVTVLTAFFGTLGLARLLGVSRGLGLMVATGFSICGASAIVAMDSVARTDKEDVAAGVTLVTLYGTLAIGLVPLIGSGMGSEFLGKWAGLSVHEVAQVVAAASPAGAAAVGIAVVVKLTRVVLLAPIVAGVGFFQRQDGPKPPVVPLFVAGFLVMILVRSTGILPPVVLDGAKLGTTVLLAAAMFGLGTTVRLRQVLRSGRKGLVLGALSTALVGAAAFGTLLLSGAA